MSPAELRFYQVLLQCIPAGHEVWAKADLSQFGNHRSAFVDFLITRGGDRNPALIIDFDDRGPLGLSAEEVNLSMITSLPILRVPMAGDYSAPSLSYQIRQSLADRQELRAA